METEINEPTKTTLKDRAKARFQTTKQFVGRHKTAFAIGAVTTPVALYLARRAGAADQLLADQDALNAYFETVDEDDDSDDTETIED